MNARGLAATPGGPRADSGCCRGPEFATSLGTVQGSQAPKSPARTAAASRPPWRFAEAGGTSASDRHDAAFRTACRATAPNRAASAFQVHGTRITTALVKLAPKKRADASSTTMPWIVTTIGAPKPRPSSTRIDGAGDEG